ncbi:MAG: integral rane sensor signal transduction histidine kinase [Bacteroidetes bacterium]|nr:integral rane sensor signal transduction histidine kinase [Bacteroidota bacterium]
MSHKGFLYIAVACLGLILLTQAYLISDYFQTTRAALTRESEAIIEEVFKKDLFLRNVSLKQKVEAGIIKKKEGTQPSKEVDLANVKGIPSQDISKKIDLVINSELEDQIPYNIHIIENITKTILKSRNIDSDFMISRIDRNGKILNQAGDGASFVFFSIKTSPLLVNLNNSESLQLTLINPFGVIVKRMALMLISSFAFAVICILAFVKLMKILARQRQLMEVKNDFFGSTAHELKRPVARLRMAIDSLGTERVDANPEKKERYLAISKEAVNEMADTINMILTLSLAEEGIFELSISKFDLALVIHQLKEQFVSTSHKPVHIDISDLPEQLLVQGDETHIRQTIANLIDNAIKYSGEEVAITIQAASEVRNLRVTIIDNGFGIAPEKQELVFQKYARVHSKEESISGFGIGLSYVKAVIEKHGGSISLSSKPNQGSEFAFSLPVGA